jgi:peptide/nickel transport system substrate-binding protein
MKGTRDRRRALSMVAVACIAAAGCARRAAAPDLLTIGVPYEIGTLDPHAEDTVSSSALLGNVYEPLVSVDGDLKSEPCLATSWGSSDAGVWMFHLRLGVRFHSGRPLTARDVVYSLKRLQANEAFYNRVHLGDVAEVTALEDSTVVIRVGGPKRNLLNSLRSAAIVPEGATETSLESAPDGTGPYRIDAWERGKTLRLRRNTSYWGRAPSLPEVEYRLGQSPDEAAAGLVAGRFGFAQIGSRKAESAVTVLPRVVVLHRESLFVHSLVFDPCPDQDPRCWERSKPFRDRRVRQAFDLAVDRRALVEPLPYDTVPAAEIVPRFVFGFDPGIEPATHDPERARGLLKEAGFGSGIAVRLLTRRILEQTASLLKEQLAVVGIDVAIQALPDAEFFAAEERREAPVYLDRSACSTGDAGEVLKAFARSGRADPDLRSAIAKSEEIEEVGERRMALQGLVRRVTTDLAMVPLYGSQDVYGLDRSLAWKPRMDGLIHAADIGLAER